jgi:hypothetical protein
MPKTVERPLLPEVATIPGRIRLRLDQLVPKWDRPGAKNGGPKADSVAKIAFECQIEKTTMSRVISRDAERPMPPIRINVDCYIRLARRLGVRLEWLLTGREPMLAQDQHEPPTVGVMVDGDASADHSDELDHVANVRGSTRYPNR